jgi:hypothetical protein
MISVRLGEKAAPVGYKSLEAEMLYKARKRADKKGMAFRLTASDIHIPPSCPILGIPLVKGDRVSWAFSPTIDRLDNDLGYTPSNVWVISNLANSMKSSARPELLRRFASWVRERYGLWEAS